MAKSSISTTRNYRLFNLSADNRPLNLKKRNRLRRSMVNFGFLRSFPLSCIRDTAGNLVVKDGQHRLAIAEELGLPVHYYVEDVDYDIAQVNCTQEKWRVCDFAMMFASKGRAAYQEGIDFADAHGLPVGTAFALLSGTISWANVRHSFMEGTFKVRDREWADAVASIYVTLTELSKDMKNSRCLEACMAICRVDDFDATRLLSGAKRCRDKLASYSTRDAYLELMETVYNFGRKQLFPLKNEAIMAMRARAAIKPKAGK